MYNKSKITLLRKQSQFRFKYEQQVYYKILLKLKMNKCLDIGSGDGSYLGYLLKIMPFNKVLALEPDVENYKYLKRLFSNDNRVDISKTNIFSLKTRIKYDLINSSLLIQHIPSEKLDESVFILSQLINKTGFLVIMEADNKQNFFYPPLSQYQLFKSKLREHQFEKGLSNEILEFMPNILKSNGFDIIDSGFFSTIILPNDKKIFTEMVTLLKDYKDKLSAKSIDEIDWKNYDDEITSWKSHKTSYAQLGSQFIIAKGSARC